MGRKIGERIRGALEAAAALGGGWICVREYAPEAHTVLRVAAPSAARIHYHPYCRACMGKFGRENCLREHGEDLRAECLRSDGAFRNTCWAGVTEEIVPLYLGGSPVAAVHLCGGRRAEDAPAAEGPAFREAWEALPEWDGEKAAAVGELLTAAFSSVGRDAEELGDSPPPEGEGPGAPAVRYYIHEHLADPELSVTTAAEAMGVSREYLSRRFRGETGITLRDYIRAERMDRARLLLRNTDRPVAEIAGQCGYADPGHFARVFRKKTGSAPGVWRRSGE